MKNWTVVFDPYSTTELTYMEASSQLDKVLSNQPFNSAYTYMVTPYMDLMNECWGNMKEGDKISIQVEIDENKDAKYFYPTVGGYTKNGKFLRKEHNIFKLWKAGGLC